MEYFTNFEAVKFIQSIGYLTTAHLNTTFWLHMTMCLLVSNKE